MRGPFLTNTAMRAAGAIPGGPVFQAARIAFDLAGLTLAWRITGELRLFLNPYMRATIDRGLMNEITPQPLVLLGLWLLTAAWLRIYRSRRDASFVAELGLVAESAILFWALNVSFTFFSRQMGSELSRSFAVILAPVTFLCLVASLAASVYVTRRIQRRWPPSKRVAVVGSEEEAEDVLAAMRRAPEQEVALRGLIVPERCAHTLSAVAESSGTVTAPVLPVLGTMRELAELINRECLDRVIVASESLTAAELEYCSRITRQMGITMSHPLRSAGSGVVVSCQVEYGLPLIDLNAVLFPHWQEVVKRGIDAVVSLALITLLLPLLGLLAFLVRLTSEGPILYKSQRVGRGGRYFTFWKFRSMRVGGPGRRELAERNEVSGHLFKIRRDPRITPVGRVMRRLSLDELPQLFNVLAGDMSLVGPRPLPAEDLDKDGMSRSFAQWAEQRSLVRPGITGLWQIRGRSDLPFEKMMKLDLEYVHRRSIALDVFILLQTPIAVLSGRGAY